MRTIASKSPLRGPPRSGNAPGLGADILDCKRPGIAGDSLDRYARRIVNRLTEGMGDMSGEVTARRLNQARHLGLLKKKVG